VTERSVDVRLRHSTIRFKPAAAGADPRYHFGINIPRGQIEDAERWIEQRHEVLAFHGDPDEAEGATIVRMDRGAAALYFLDGVGNRCVCHAVRAPGAKWTLAALTRDASDGTATVSM
jgi:hypothetical protein